MHPVRQATVTLSRRRENSLRSGVLRFSDDYAVLYFGLSDKDMVYIFYHGAFKGLLYKLLSLAWLEGTDSEDIPDFIQSVPAHEARHSLLVSLIRDIDMRIHTLDQLSEMELPGFKLALTSLLVAPSTPLALAGSFIG
jgi:hypothetical protein